VLGRHQVRRVKEHDRNPEPDRTPPLEMIAETQASILGCVLMV
jgi:hypothetical protein